LLCTSLSILHGRKASCFVHGWRYGVGLSVKVGLGWLGLYLLWGKPRLVTSRSRPGLVIVPKALAMARLSVVASPFAILPPSSSLFCPLVPYYYTPLFGWHPTAPHRLAPYGSWLAGIPSAWWLRSPLYPPRSSHFSSVTPSRGIALPPWLPPTPWSNDVITGAAVVYGSSVGPHVQWFSFNTRSLSSPSGPESTLAKLSFILGSLRKGLGLSTYTFL